MIYHGQPEADSGMIYHDSEEKRAKRKEQHATSSSSSDRHIAAATGAAVRGFINPPTPVDPSINAEEGLEQQDGPPQIQLMRRWPNSVLRQCRRFVDDFGAEHGVAASSNARHRQRALRFRWQCLVNGMKRDEALAQRAADLRSPLQTELLTLHFARLIMVSFTLSVR